MVRAHSGCVQARCESLPALLGKSGIETRLIVGGGGKSRGPGSTLVDGPILEEGIATWLILPVVICLSQRLSHACVSINSFVL